MPRDSDAVAIGRREFLTSSAVVAAGLLACGTPPTGAAADEPPPVTPTAPVGPVYPDLAFSRPVEDRWPVFSTLSGCAIGLDALARAVHLPQCDLRLQDGPHGTCANLRFTPRGIDGLSLRLDEKLRRVPTAVTLELVNHSALPIRVALQVQELPWVPGRESQAVLWTLGEAQTAGPAEQCSLTFAWPDCFCRELPRPRPPRFPMSALFLQFQDLQGGAEYNLDLLSFTVHHGVPSLRLRSLQVPQTLCPGAEAHFALVPDGDKTPTEELSIEVRQGPWVLWRFVLTENERRQLDAGDCTVTRTVPWYLGPGEVEAGLVADGYRVVGRDGREMAAQARVVPGGGAPRLALAERRVHNGRPTCFVDGEPFAWCGYSSADFQPGNVAEFGAHGTSVFCIPTDAGAHIYHHTAAPTLVAPGEWDFGELEQRVGMSLQANPAARLMLRVSLGMPPFWTQRHESEQVLVETAAGRVPWYEYTAYQAPSLASEVWRRDQAEALRELLRYCKSRPWAGRLIGFWLTGEVTEEWFAWGSNDGQHADYSRPTSERFAARLADCGWTATDTSLPTPEQRDVKDRDLYPDTVEGRRAAAYNRFYSELTAETILHFARVVKEETDGRSLVGAFYGYVIQLAGEPRQSNGGNMALRRLLDDEAVDFVGGIPLHDFRRLSGGYDPYVSATESILAAGKLYCNENDLFSWLHPVIWYTEYDAASPRAGAISMHRRECANDAVHGAMSQRFGLMSSWHHDAELQADFALQSRVCAEALGLDRTPVEQIAMLVDDSSFAWAPPGSTLARKTNKELLHRLGHTGAPVGVWLLSDAGRLPDRVRLVVVASGSACDAETLAGLRDLLAAGGRTVLVVGTPGLVDPAHGVRQPQAVAELLGLPIRVVEEARQGGMVLSSDGSWITPDEGTVCPRAELDQPGFLRYPDGPAASAEAPLPNSGRLLWCGLPPLTTWPLLKWAEEAGVHTYAPDGYFVWASRELVSITAPAQGDVEIRFPSASVVKDLFDGWIGRGEVIACPFATGQTRLLRVTRGS